MQINLIEARCQAFKIYFYRGFFTLVEKPKFIMLVLDVPKAGEEDKSVPTTSCSLERGGAPQLYFGWRLSGCLSLISFCLRVLYDLSPCLNGNVRCSSDRQVGARKRLNMTRHSGFKLYCKKGRDLMLGIKRKAYKAGLNFFLTQSLWSDLLDFKEISTNFWAKASSNVWASQCFSQEIDRTDRNRVVTIVLIEIIRSSSWISLPESICESRCWLPLSFEWSIQVRIRLPGVCLN